MRVIVVGAGIAGLSATINLVADGHNVTVIDRADQLRTGGSPIDIRGEALEVTERMDILESIYAHRIDMTERVQFVDSKGTTIAEVPPEVTNDSPDDIEIPRAGLLGILFHKATQSVPVRFGESIARLQTTPAGVLVDFTSGATDRYDLVVGADGMHSVTRRLAFGPEREYLHHLGFYVAIAALPGQVPAGRVNPMYNFPGHLAGILTYNTSALTVLAFRSPWLDYDYHDLDAQKQILIDTFGDHAQWRVPEVLDAVRRDPQLYFDSVSQIIMPTWHTERIVLVGDAAHCASNLSGRGTSLALTGSWLLAEALRAHPGDIPQALAQYEDQQRPHVTRAQATAGPGGELMIPATQADIDARNRALQTS